MAASPALRRDPPRRMAASSRGFRAAAAVAGALGAGSAAGLAAQALYVVRRPLPTMSGHHGSTMLPGSVQVPASRRVVAVGDSSLTGPGLADVTDIWIVNALAHAVHEAQVPFSVFFDNRAVGGSTAGEVLCQQTGRLPACDLAILSVGANDVIRGTRLGRYRGAVNATLALLRARTDQIIVLGVPPLGVIPRVPSGLSQILDRRSERFNRIARRAAEDSGAAFVDPWETRQEFAQMGTRWFAGDWFHLNADGHARIARESGDIVATWVTGTAKTADSPAADSPAADSPGD